MSAAVGGPLFPSGLGGFSDAKPLATTELSKRPPEPGTGNGEQSVVSLAVALLGAMAPLLGVEERRQLALALTGKQRRQRRRHRHRGMTIARLCTLYEEFAQTYYNHPSGGRTSESSTIHYGLRPLRQRFGRTQVADFGPRRFKEVREAMVQMGWCRKQINQQAGRIKRMFKWGVENELIPAHLFQSLQAVPGLRAGRTAARESDPVKPVPEGLIEPMLAHVSTPVRAMIQLQRLTGMRPGEVIIMRTCDIDTSGQPWMYKPEHHKTEHHNHERLVFLGPQAQEIVRPFLRPDSPAAYLFSPIKAEEERRARLHALRKTPMSCGNVPGSNRKRRPHRRPRDCYDTASYRRAIEYGCIAAFPPPEGLSAEEAKAWKKARDWHPHQLRHNAATKLRKEFGLDVAQVVLGHKTLEVTQVYAEKDVEAAKRIMAEVG